MQKGIRMKLYIKTYLSELIASIIFTCIGLVSFYVFFFFKIDDLGIMNVFFCVIGGLSFILGLASIVTVLKKMKRLKHLLKNGIHTKAVITKPYPLKMDSTFEEALKPEDGVIGSLLFPSIQYQFQNERGETITIDQKKVDIMLQYLCEGSKIHILYDPFDEEQPLICPWWDEWIANNELYAYPKFITDIATSTFVGKQRHIPLFRLFSLFSLIITVIVLSCILIFAISFSLQENPSIVSRLFAYGWGLVPLSIIYLVLKSKQSFYEYAVQTAALVESVRVVTRTKHRTTSHHRRRMRHKEITYTVVCVAYQFLSSSEDNIFRGYCELQDTPENLALKKGAEIEILYHAQKPYKSRLFTPKDKKYIY